MSKQRRWRCLRFFRLRPPATKFLRLSRRNPKGPKQINSLGLSLCPSASALIHRHPPDVGLRCRFRDLVISIASQIESFSA
jgi:hypothetical protein